MLVTITQENIIQKGSSLMYQYYCICSSKVTNFDAFTNNGIEVDYEEKMSYMPIRSLSSMHPITHVSLTVEHHLQLTSDRKLNTNEILSYINNKEDKFNSNMLLEIEI